MSEQEKVVGIPPVVPAKGPDYQTGGLPIATDITTMTRDYADEPLEKDPKGKPVDPKSQVYFHVSRGLAESYDPDREQREITTDIRRAVVMDVDAKLITSTPSEMRRGVFKETHFPNLEAYMKSPYYHRFREAHLRAKAYYNLTLKKLRESRGVPAPGEKPNQRNIKIGEDVFLAAPHLRMFKKIDSKLKESIVKTLHLKESDVDPFDTGDFPTPPTTNPPGQPSIDSTGRVQEYIPLMSGPYNKQLYYYDYLLMHARAFQSWTHNPIAKRICKLITQFVLAGGVKATIVKATYKDRMQRVPRLDKNGKPIQNSRGETLVGPKEIDETSIVQQKLNLHWKKNKLQSRLKKILRELVIFGEQMIRYFPTEWGYKIRQLDPSTVWEIVTDPDDVETVYYYHCQYPTQYQWFVDIPVPSLRYIIRQIPAKNVIHFKINNVSNEKRGRSELFAILGWLKRYTDYLTDRVILNKIRAMFGLDVKVEGDAQDVQTVQSAFSSPLTPGSLFVHSATVTVEGVEAKIAASDSKSDNDMLLTIIGLGVGISEQYLGLAPATTRASALVGTEPDAKNFEEYQSIIEEFLQADAEKVFERLRDLKQIHATDIEVEFEFPEIAPEDRSAKLKDVAFVESMGHISHRRAAVMSARELKLDTYDYDQEMENIDQESEREIDINKLYAQIAKGNQPGTTGGGGIGTPFAGGKSTSGSVGPMGSGGPGPSAKPLAPEMKEHIRQDRNTMRNVVMEVVQRAFRESDAIRKERYRRAMQLRGK